MSELDRLEQTLRWYQKERTAFSNRISLIQGIRSEINGTLADLVLKINRKLNADAECLTCAIKGIPRVKVLISELQESKEPAVYSDPCLSAVLQELSQEEHRCQEEIGRLDACIYQTRLAIQDAREAEAQPVGGGGGRF